MKYSARRSQIRLGNLFKNGMKNMTREQLAFIQILSDHLNGRKTEEIRDVDWNIIYSYARMHQVSGMIYTQAKSFMPAEALNRFLQDTIATVCVAEKREEDFTAIKNSFREASIPYFIVKGPEVASFYPIPKLRSMGDIDIVVHTENREECHEIFLQEGFHPESNQEDREWQYYKNGLEMELHDRLIYKESVNEEGQEAFFNDCWKYVDNGKLDWNFHLLFLIFHLRKHLMNSGAGYRHFMDLAIVAKKTDIDWEWLKRYLKITGMFKFARKCYGFIDQWFGIRVPISEKIDDEFYEDATQRIFRDGVFGFDNPENRENMVINQIRNKRLPKIGMIKMALHNIFPSRNELRQNDQYKYLNVHPALLPIAWIHRMIRGNNSEKRKSMSKAIKRTFITNEKIDERRDMLMKWGL